MMGGTGIGRTLAMVLIAGAAGAGLGGAARAAGAYPAMAPLREYLMADRGAEIALARSAAPAAVSRDAKVLVLGPKGYVTAAAGKSGFVCLVMRAWTSGFRNAEFWNPKERAPICFNPQAARSVLPTFLTRTDWVLAGVSRAQMEARTRAAMAAGKLGPPEIGAITYMMSKKGYLGDDPHGPWRPHLMFFMPPQMRTADWGADSAGAPVSGSAAPGAPYTMFYVPVAKWSDGTPDGS